MEMELSRANARKKTPEYDLRCLPYFILPLTTPRLRASACKSFYRNADNPPSTAITWPVM
jgi:hypothetical protein